MTETEVDKNKFPGCEESLMEFKNRVIDMYLNYCTEYNLDIYTSIEKYIDYYFYDLSYSSMSENNAFQPYIKELEDLDDMELCDMKITKIVIKFVQKTIKEYLKSEFNRRMERAKKYLENLAKEKRAKYYEIVEDTYKYENGLLLITYDDKEHECENGYTCVNVDDF